MHAYTIHLHYYLGWIKHSMCTIATMLCTHTYTHTHTGSPRCLSTAPTTTNITNTSVVVSWQFPGGYVDFYDIQYKLSSVEWTSPDGVRDINVMGVRTSVPINGLLPNTVYDLRIRTRNASGQSEWSPEATFMTQCKS